MSSKQPKSNQILNDYKLSKQLYQIDNMSCYEGQLKQNPSLKYTIKILKKADNDIYQYLKSLKSSSSSSEYIIKIINLVFNQQQKQIVLIQQHVTYGNLKNALKKCKRLDDDDSITVAKLLLNGHIQLLRSGVYWYGDDNDIQITQNGIKLSWNNTFPYSHNNQNPFPGILSKLGQRKQINNSILPFPKNKMLQDLIKVSKQNASQMSLHPLLKKKQKIFKKKGKYWLGIKQSNIKGQYQQQLSYLAISKQHGFIRIKVFQPGNIDQQLIKIHQSIPSFIKLLDYYQQSDKQLFIFEYSNDGTVFSYVKRLRANNILLKQSQIQFFFYSLIEPLKLIHKSTVVSLNMLNIKNVFIQDGIVKIGQINTMNQKLKQKLIQRADIPDFYHNKYKHQPQSKNQIYDTYSLGVLLYKLMYTQYPIFPQGKVHVPTTPNYKPKLKSILQLFLNIGGSLTQLQQNIQISEQVKLQVKNNQKLLEQINNNKNTMNRQYSYKYNNSVSNNYQIQKNHDIVSQLSLRQEENNKDDQLSSNKSKCNKFYQWFMKRGLDRDRKYQMLEKSNFAIYRQFTAIMLIISLYFFGFFIVYMQGVYNLLSHTRLFTKADINIQGKIHQVIVPSYSNFLQVYESYSLKSLSVLSSDMGCRLDNKNIYYEFIRPGSPHWYLFIFLSIILMFTILILKSIQLFKYSTSTMSYHYYNRTIDGANLSRFALSSYILFQMWFGMVLYAFYYLFNVVYNVQYQPCFGGNNWTLLTETLMKDRYQFTQNYFVILLVVFLFGLISFLQVTLLFNKINYDQLCNPIIIFTPFYFLLFIALRVGVYQKFNPSWLYDTNKIIGHGYMNTIGYFPEILIIIQIIISVFIDLLFSKYLDRKIEHLLLDQGSFVINQNQNQKNQEK